MLPEISFGETAIPNCTWRHLTQKPHRIRIVNAGHLKPRLADLAVRARRPSPPERGVQTFLSLCSLICPAHPPLDSGAGSATGADAFQGGGEISGGKSDQRVTGFERGYQDLTDFAGLHWISCARADNLQQEFLHPEAVLPDLLIRNRSIPHLP